MSVALSVPLSDNVQHARASTDLCVYHLRGRPGAVALINVVTGKASSLVRFAKFLRLAGDRSQPIAGLGDVAYTIGPNVVALRGDTLIVASVGETGASRSALRTASIQLARSAANSWIAMSSTCEKHSARVSDAATYTRDSEDNKHVQ